MSSGVHGAAPVTIFSRVDADALVAFRARRKADTASSQVPSYNDILVHLTALTLREVPELNACWFREGIHQYDEVHIALAVDTPHGLLAPVLRHADRLDLDQVCAQSRELIDQARAGRLAPQQLEGGTFTVTNLGMFGIDAFTPILNLPQAAILGVGRILLEPVVRDGQISIGHTLTLSLTFDHRVVDGAPAARWLQQLAHQITILVHPG
jgi:pyruvate dehydrogenase E2 component (dihydrolipoamide acetyltransferase)